MTMIVLRKNPVRMAAVIAGFVLALVAATVTVSPGVVEAQAGTGTNQDVSAALPPEPTAASPSQFACASDAGELTWTDATQTKYWIYKKAPADPTFNWLGRTLGTTTFTDLNPTTGTTYQVHYAGIDRVECTTTTEPDDNNNGCTIQGAAIETAASAAECDALVALYNEGDGPDWTNAAGWNTATDPCAWDGVTCDANGISALDLASNWVPRKEVAIVVNGNLADALGDRFDRFLTDLRLDGYEPSKVLLGGDETPPELRASLQNLWTDSAGGLDGAILIGEVPNPRYYTYHPEDTAPDGTNLLERLEEGISYEYYEDLDGIYDLRDASIWQYENHRGDVESEIWVSALAPMATFAETVDAISSYLDRNHRYRHGLDGQQAGVLNPILGGEFRTPELYAHQVDYIRGRAPNSAKYSWRDLMDRGNVEITPNNYLNDPVNYPGGAEAYGDMISSGDFDVLLSSTHGSPYGIVGYDRSYLNNHPLNVTLWIEGGCATADLDVVPSFGVTALYSPTSSVLAYAGATTNQGGRGWNETESDRFTIGRALADGESIGSSWLAHRSQAMRSGSYGEAQRDYFAASFVLLGDGTISLRDAEATTQTPTGDVNCDGTVDMADVTAIAEFVQGERTATEQCPLNSATELRASAGDVNRDGATDMADAYRIMRCVLGLDCPS